MLCIVCKEELAENASYCHHCNHYQKAWINVLKLSSSLVGIFSIVISAFFFGFTKWPEVRKAISPNKNIEILNFTVAGDSGGITIQNSGDGEVWIAGAALELYKTKIKFYDVQMSDFTVNPGTVFAKNRVGGERGDEPLEAIIMNVPPSRWHEFNPKPAGCYSIEISAISTKNLEKFNAKDKQSMPFDWGEGVLDYYYLETKEWLKKEFQIMATLYHLPHYCEDKE